MNSELFIVDRNLNSSVFTSAEFNDRLFVKSYLKKMDSEKKIDYRIDFFSSIIEKYSELRGYADTQNSNSDYYEVINKKVLPISDEDTYKIIFDESGEAPQRLISTIAQNDFYLIKNVGNSLRKILRRERSNVSVAKAQQMDSQCLIWLSKQPGYTTAEKAGSKQQVLSVVRCESYDTLENRVFKDFLHLCIVEGIAYIRECREKYPQSKRVYDVKKLVILASSLLNLPEMDGISSLKMNPKPNYVLQNNVNYSTIWKRYQELRKKHQIIEDLWPYRHYILQEYVALLMNLSFFRFSESKVIFTSRFWVSDIHNSNNKGFLIESNKINLFDIANVGYIPLFFTKSDSSEIAIRVIGNDRRIIHFPFYYIP